MQNKDVKEQEQEVFKSKRIDVLLENQELKTYRKLLPKLKKQFEQLPQSVQAFLLGHYTFYRTVNADKYSAEIVNLSNEFYRLLSHFGILNASKYHLKRFFEYEYYCQLIALNED